MAAAGEDAYCTLLLTDSYLPGAMVLAHSLRDNGTRKQIVALVTMDSVSASTVQELQTVYDRIIPVDRIVNKQPANLYLMDRPDLGSTFTKIALWRQTQYRRIVYIDSDVVALRAPDELFMRESSFAAVPDVGWPDCFNSGVMALSPNMGDYYALLALAQRGISFDGADQGLLNMHFPNWDRLSFTYNCTPSGHYQYVPAYKHFESSISMVHYIGKDKPWLVGRESRGSTSVYEELLGRWWSVYDKHYRYPTTAYIAGQSRPDIPRNVQQYVAGEASTADYGYSSIPIVMVADALGNTQAPAEPDQPLLDRPDPVESIETLNYLPPSTAQQRPFAAPQSEWDPIRQPPPAESRPEAANFPSEQYTMSGDTSLFQAPKSYPEPPKDMYYEVSKRELTPELKPIFPWEATQAKPTRIFPEDIAALEPPAVPELEPKQDQEPESVLEPELGPSTNAEIGDTPLESPVNLTMQAPRFEPFSSFSRTNAWDEMPEIDRYVNALNVARRGGKPPVSPSSIAAHNGSLISGDSESIVAPQARRRSSLRLTDFPSEFERPSLPVTPAPIRRPSFWGEEPEATRDLPGADGVPRQQDWDPLRKLEELQKRQSAVLAQGPPDLPTDLPERKLPESSERATLSPTSEETDIPMTSVSAGVTDAQVPLEHSEGLKAGEASPPRFYSALKYDPDERGSSGADEGVFSPTES